jgi:TatD DNase family protein
MAPYVNIHTHHLSKDNGVFLFNNRFGFDKTIYTQSYFSVGIHPWDAELLNQKTVKQFKQFIGHENCLAIGECGLDKLKGPDPELQKIIFETQIQLALKYKKPVIIHCVKAFDELQEMCVPYLKKIPLIIHGFNKSVQLAQQLIDKGFYLSVSSDFIIKSNVGELPMEKLFFETDDKQALSISDVYDIASRKLSLDKVILKEKIYSNFTSLFKVKLENE